MAQFGDNRSHRRPRQMPVLLSQRPREDKPSKASMSSYPEEATPRPSEEHKPRPRREPK